MDLFEDWGAEFSPCRSWRYKLWRRWNRTKPALTFLMLNPSEANEAKNDPTVGRCYRRAQRDGFGQLYVLNIFGLVSTDPQGLYTAADPVGPDNDKAILEIGRHSIVVCAWGVHGAYRARARHVYDMLRAARVQPHVLALNKDGSPGHPLYLPNSLEIRPWEGPK